MVAGAGRSPSDEPCDSVTVLFFAAAREAAGSRRAYLAATEVPTVGELVKVLLASHGPELARVLQSCAIWVNGLPSHEDGSLRAGDEVAVLPPVSGG
jgi:molybdopterin converting factor small subunit